MNAPCSRSIRCPGTDDPVQNLSSEREDGIDYIATTWERIETPIGRSWMRSGCLFTCISLESQLEANLCAERQAFLCACAADPDVCSGGSSENDGDDIGGPGDGSNSGTTVGNTIFSSTKQCCTASCPDGTLFTYCVAAGAYMSYSQEVANQKAYQLACRAANYHRACMNDINELVCEGGTYSAAITASGGVPPYTNEIVSGALPDGVFPASAADGSMVLFGTASAAGSYTFTVRITDSRGNYSDKTYTVTVVEITSPSTLTPTEKNVAYSYQLAANIPGNQVWSLASGTLPDGMTLSLDGLIHGTCPTYQSKTFTVRCAGDITCEKTLLLEVKCEPTIPSEFADLQWTTDSSSGAVTFSKSEGNLAVSGSAGSKSEHALIVQRSGATKKIACDYVGTLTGKSGSQYIQLALYDMRYYDGLGGGFVGLLAGISAVFGGSCATISAGPSHQEFNMESCVQYRLEMTSSFDKSDCAGATALSMSLTKTWT